MNCGCTSTTTSTPATTATCVAENGSKNTDALTFLAPVDMYETEEQVVIIADVPGARAEDLDVRVDEGVLTVNARVRPRHPENARALMGEYRVGNFTRSFQVGSGVESAGITAEISAGVLTLRIPKAEAVRPRKIAVKAV